MLLESVACTVQELYRLGARRIGVTSMPPLGCLPASIRLYGKGGSGCVRRLNGDAETFNRKLNATVEALAKRHADLRIAIFDIYTPLRDLSEAPAAQGPYGIVKINPCVLMS